MLGGLIALMVSIIGRSCMERWEITKVPVPGMMVIIGAIGGGVVIWCGTGESFEFDTDIFWDIFLPFILLEASMTIDKGRLKKYFGIVGLFAFAGTILNTALIGTIMWAASSCLSENPLPIIDALLFGSLIAATDAIASVSVFKFFGVDPQIYILVVGETLLNDAVAVVLYLVFLRFSELDGSFDSEAIIFATMTLFFDFFGSIALGILLGALGNKCLKMLKMRDLKQPLLETVLFVSIPLLAYYIGEIASLSGIVTISICGLHIDVYARKQLSSGAQHHIHFVIEGAGMVFESITFIYMGAFMVIEHDKYWWDWRMCTAAVVAIIFSRGVSTIFLSSIWNNFARCKNGLVAEKQQRKQQQRVEDTPPASQTATIPFKHQMVLWWSGLRGPLSFVLALSIPQENALSASGNEHARLILAMTTVVIVALTGLLGSNMLPVLQCAGIEMSRRPEEQQGKRLAEGGGRGVKNILSFACGQSRHQHLQGSESEFNSLLGICGASSTMCSSDIPHFTNPPGNMDDLEDSVISDDDHIFCSEPGNQTTTIFRERLNAQSATLSPKNALRVRFADTVDSSVAESI